MHITKPRSQCEKAALLGFELHDSLEKTKPWRKKMGACQGCVGREESRWSVEEAV